ncbi:DUF3078 domain-containing protein [Owenweeksia hongkongensis]|uniref:DUF3078 domain-containing protein n=1 Tax=Owenweeksia hongkongensis (strain DSM 17368 / CIP 108786 / JCM 12287 / NRRL B-23963 / UST20020801) TaxID=926562 RepID=G8R4T1_OWEHD|nr:DUF3078 domain-containing protein [Owenweeksia hongkongensis]AEV33205.1 Protein of unknown function (DUF3078) [Owenweeksia hongkongensis DSM 17368]
MRKISILLITLFAGGYAFGQTDSATAAQDTAWKVGGNMGLQFAQSSYQNWQAGGVNSVAGNAIFSVFANYDNGGDWGWANSLDVAYGLNLQEDVFNKTDDRFELVSRVDRHLSKNWSLSGELNFRTQLTDGYSVAGSKDVDDRISRFMAPGYLLVGLGATYAPNENFTVYISPATSKMTFVQDQVLADAGSFGVEAADTVNGAYVAGKQFRYEIGGYVNVTYRRELLKNVDMQFKLDLFSNYLDGQYKYIDVNSEFKLFMKVNDFISASVALNLIYDHDILFDTNNDGIMDGPRTQFKEVIGVGFAYNFGYQPK